MWAKQRRVVVLVFEGDDVVNVRESVFVFFKQKTAYEMLRSLVGSEMCIRDRSLTRRSGLTPVAFKVSSARVRPMPKM